MSTDPHDALTHQVIGLGMKVHRALGPGFVEFVYRNSLLHELRKAHIKTEVEKPIQVTYDGVVVGTFNADLFLEGWLVCELKAVQTLVPEHEVQLVNYLSAMDQEYGLLLNFGTRSLQVKRKYRRVEDRIREDSWKPGQDLRERVEAGDQRQSAP